MPSTSSRRGTQQSDPLATFLRGNLRRQPQRTAALCQLIEGHPPGDGAELIQRQQTRSPLPSAAVTPRHGRVGDQRDQRLCLRLGHRDPAVPSTTQYSTSKSVTPDGPSTRQRSGRRDRNVERVIPVSQVVAVWSTAQRLA